MARSWSQSSCRHPSMHQPQHVLLHSERTVRGVPTDADRDPTAIAERGAGRRAALLPTKNSLENQSQAISQRGRNTRTGLGFDRVWSCCIDARVWQGSAKHVTHSLSIRTCAGEPRSVTRIRAGRLLGAHATAARSGISNRLHRPFRSPLVTCHRHLPTLPPHPGKYGWISRRRHVQTADAGP